MRPLDLMRCTVFVSVTVFTLMGCSDDNHATNGTHEEMVHVHGVVLGITCPYSFYPQERPFASVTGEAADVSFTNVNGIVSSVMTGDASTFDVSLSPGLYTLVVKTGFSYPPDTLHDLLLQAGDTSLSVTVHVEVLDPLQITFVFRKSNPLDTLDADGEWEVLLELNRLTQVVSGKPIPALDILGSHASDWRLLHGSYAVYELPIVRERPIYGELYNVIEVDLMLTDLLETDTTGLAPPGFYLYPSGIYACRD